MLAEFLQKILDNANLVHERVEDRPYVSHPKHVVFEPVQVDLAEPLQTHTLTGLVDALNSGVIGVGPYRIEVRSPTLVEVAYGHLDEWNRRQKLLVASLRSAKSDPQLGQWLDLETQMINLLTNFVADDGRDMLIKVLKHVATNREAVTADDGISQQVTVKTGIATVGTAKIENPVTLRPYRTFLEIEQPQSAFVFRMRQGDRGGTQAAIFEADGGKWQLDAIRLVLRWLSEQLKDFKMLPEKTEAVPIIA